MWSIFSRLICTKRNAAMEKLQRRSGLMNLSAQRCNREASFLQRRTGSIVARKFWSTLVEIAPLWDLSAVLGISIGLSIRKFRSVALAVAHFSDDCKKRKDQKQYDRNSI